VGIVWASNCLPRPFEAHLRPLSIESGLSLRRATCPSSELFSRLPRSFWGSDYSNVIEPLDRPRGSGGRRQQRSNRLFAPSGVAADVFLQRIASQRNAQSRRRITSLPSCSGFSGGTVA